MLAARLNQKSSSSIGLSFAGPDFTNSTHSGALNSGIFFRASANFKLNSCAGKSYTLFILAFLSELEQHKLLTGDIGERGFIMFSLSEDKHTPYHNSSSSQL